MNVGSMTEEANNKLAVEILSYLMRHPEAQDTLEGIVRWWLLEQDARRAVMEVRETLESLVAKGWIRRLSSSAGERFGIQKDKISEILQFLPPY